MRVYIRNNKKKETINDNKTKINWAIIVAIFGSVLASSVSAYIAYANNRINKQIMAGNNLQKDKEILLQQLFGISNCYVLLSDEITNNDSLFNIYQLTNIYKKQFEYSSHLSVFAPGEIASKTAWLNRKYLALVQDIDKSIENK